MSESASRSGGEYSDDDRTGGVRVLAYADLESVYDHPERVAGLAGGIRARRDDRTLVVGAGDDTALGVLAEFGEGRAAARPFFEAVAPDAETFGNHDFDPGAGAALEWAASVPPAYLAANVDLDCPGRALFDVDGTRVGVFGVAHPDTATACPAVSDVAFGDPAAAAREATAALRREGADVVLGVSHCGDDAPIARAADVDAVVGGHVHTRRRERVAGTLLVRPRSAGRDLLELELGNGDATATFHDPTGGPAVESLAETYRRRRADAGLDDVVARVEDPIPRGEAERFGGESRAGNFVADAYRAAADSDVGLVPAGTLRTGPRLSGAVTVGEVVAVAPFGGDVLVEPLPGDRLRALLADVAGRDDDRGWLRAHLSGVRARWTADGDLAAATVDGDPIADDATYTVASLAWAPHSGFLGLDADRVTATAGGQTDALVAHARRGGLSVGVEGRLHRER